MERLLSAAADLVALLPQGRIEALADRTRGVMPGKNDPALREVVTTPGARASLDRVIDAWNQTNIPGDVLAGILVGAAFVSERARSQSKVELVWTGPTTPFAATRRTEQVLLDLISQAQRQLFIVSFVAYDVATIVDALNAASARGVEIRMLLEASTSQGGSLSINPIATMRSCVPLAELYAWTDRSLPFTEGRVHAKVVVADANKAFLTSANLTGHALEKNMEAGLLVTGNEVPETLHNHLFALINTKIICRV